MNILIWILIYLVCISICAFSCIATDTKSIFLNIIIGSLILFSIIYYSSKLIDSDIVRLIVVTITLLFNSVFYNNYKLSIKCIMLFIVEGCFLLIVFGMLACIKEFFGFSYVISLCVTCVLIGVFGFCVAIILGRSIKRVNIRNLLFKCKLVTIKGYINFWMYLDSGNLVTAGLDGIPVIFINKGRLKNFEGKVKSVKIKSAQGIVFKVDVILTDNFYIYINGKWIKKEVAIGSVDDTFKLYDGILNLKII